MFTDGGWEDYWGTMSGVWLNVAGPATGGMLLDQYQPRRLQRDLPRIATGSIAMTPVHSGDPGLCRRNIGMLADIVFYYWRRDLRADGDDQVPPLLTSWDDDESADSAANFWNPRNDPATWQHLSFYAVGLGVDGAVTPSGVSPFGTYQLDGVVKSWLSRFSGFPAMVPVSLQR
jgi:hypothetical protein